MELMYGGEEHGYLTCYIVRFGIKWQANLLAPGLLAV